MKTTIIAWLILSGCASALAAPKITCEQPKFDFGARSNTLKVEHSFTLTNTGDQPLVIDRVQTSCGCTVAEVNPKTVEPGQSTQVKSVLDLANRKGPMNKVLTVFSNDPAAPQLQLFLNGQATVDVELTPPFLFLPGVPYGQVSTGEVVLAAYETNVVKVVGVSSSSPFVTATFENQPGGKRAVVRLSGQVPEGGPMSASGRVTVQTDHPRYPALALDFNFSIIDKLSIVPLAMGFSIPTGPGARPPVPTQRYVYVRPGTVRDFKLKEAVWPLPGVKTNIANLGPQGYRVEFSGIQPTQELNGKDIILRTDVPGREEFKIPLSIAVYNAIPPPPGAPPAVVPPAPAIPAPAKP
jgi:hypothetical protein